MTRAMLKFLLAAAVVACIGGCALGLVPLSADPIDSQVVDLDTGTPIEGAVVMAYWELHSGSLSGDSLPCGAANVEDAVTDKDGKFHVAGWGPTRPGCGGEMRQGNPHLYVFKPGYYYTDVPNGTPDTRSVTTTHNAWAGQSLKLRPIKDAQPVDTGMEERKDFHSLETSMAGFIEDMPSQCNWKKAPNMLRALALQRQAFHQAGYPYFGIIDILTVNDLSYQKRAPQCGSPKAFVEGLAK